MLEFKLFSLLIILQYAYGAVNPDTLKSANHLRVALDGLEDSNPSQKRGRADEQFHSVYGNDKTPIVPGGGVKKQYYFNTEDYMVYDGPRERVIPFFDPEALMNCNCDQTFPPELDVPHRFVVYHPVTVQAPLPDVPKDLCGVYYTGFYYACPFNTNPYEFAWYQNRQQVNPCKWMWYQSAADYEATKVANAQ